MAISGENKAEQQFVRSSRPAYTLLRLAQEKEARGVRVAEAKVPVESVCPASVISCVGRVYSSSRTQ
jgi:hypothetical protein